MFEILSHKTYRILFASQIIGLIGVGLTTVALGLLAFDLAGKEAGSVLGTALAIKMIAYVMLSPIMDALTSRFARKPLLVGLHILRGLLVACLPFVSEVWHIYVIIFFMQAASATYTPAFQALIPTILKDREDYTKALSLSRLSYDMENLLSPMLAASLLSVLTYHTLFLGTSLAFSVASLLVITANLPKMPQLKKEQDFTQRVTQGLRTYISVPRLRGLMGVNLAVASAGAMVIVNTVVYVQHQFKLGEQETAFALAAFGGGSMLGALLLPKLLHRVTERILMRAASLFFVFSLFATLLLHSYLTLLCLWCLIGFFYASAVTPIGRLLEASSTDETRASLFTAQFALSHLCWLFTYPISGWVGARYGLDIAALCLALMAGMGVIIILKFWNNER